MFAATRGSTIAKMNDTLGKSLHFHASVLTVAQGSTLLPGLLKFRTIRNDVRNLRTCQWPLKPSVSKCA
jgi:hypothetical protein